LKKARVGVLKVIPLEGELFWWRDDETIAKVIPKEVK